MTYFGATLVLVNLGSTLPTFFEGVFYVASAASLLGGPLWLTVAVVLASLQRHQSTGLLEEKVQIAIVLVALAGYVVASFWLD